LHQVYGICVLLNVGEFRRNMMRLKQIPFVSEWTIYGQCHNINIPTLRLTDLQADPENANWNFLVLTTVSLSVHLNIFCIFERAFRWKAAEC